MKKVLPLLALISLILTGCWDQAVIEKTGFILLQGVEVSDQNNLLVTNVIPVIGIEEKDKVQVISVTAQNLRDSRETARHMASQGLTGGKMQELLFSAQIAQKGLHDLLEIYERDPSNPVLAYVVVVDGSPKDLIDKISGLENRPILPTYIHELLQQNMQKMQIPETRIYQYDIDYFADGIDPVTPLIKLEGDNVVVEGSALFTNDRMVGKIDASQTELLEAIKGKFRPTEFTFTSPEFSNGDSSAAPSSGLNMMIGKASAKVNICIENGIPVIDVALRLKGSISEYRWDSLDENQKQSELESAMTNEINARSNELIKYLQSVGSDPIGFGNMIRVKYNAYWKSVKWEEIYKKAQIHVNADVTYQENGAIT